MKTIAYSYSDPLLESVPEQIHWGREVDRVYQDLGDRLQLQQLLQDCQTDPVEYLLVRHLAELGDSVQDISDRFLFLEQCGIQLIAINAPIPAPISTTEGLQRSDLLHLLQTVQDQQRRQSIQRGHARNRIKALPPPGKAPYGYRRGKDRYTIDRTTAPIVKEFFEHFLLYGSLRSSVRHIEKRYGKKISVSTGQRWLTNPVYRGDLAYKSGDVIADTHVAILAREEAAQVDRLLRRNRRLPSRTASAPRSLAGLVVCANCQSAMTVARVTARRKSQEYLYLRPIACGKVATGEAKCRAIAYEQVLEQTIQQICVELPRAVDGIPLPNVEAAKQGLIAHIAAKQSVLSQLPTLIETGVLDAETAAMRAYKVRSEISALEAQAAQLPPSNLKAIAQAVSIPQFWLDLSEAERRFYFREFIRQIQLIRQGNLWNLNLIFIF